MSAWVVLRCGQKRTEQVVASLNAGDWGESLEAWTPMWKCLRRLPRSEQRGWVIVPALPSYVFLPADNLLAAVGIMQLSACPSFSPMAIMGRLVRLEERELEPMRHLSCADVDIIKKPLPAVGSEVRVKSGSFQGLKGKVVKNLKRESYIRFPGYPHQVKIPPFLLENYEA